MTAIAVLTLAACRTIRPPGGAPIAPLTANSAREAAQQLAARRSEFRGERSLIRLRMPAISTRGQLQVDGAGHMLLTIYTPIGTTGARLYTDGDEITFIDDFNSTAWRGKASEFAGSFGMFGTNLPAMGLLLIGLPPGNLPTIDYGPAGMQHARFEDVMVTYDPPVYPPKHVVIDRGMHHLEIDHLETYSDPESLKAPEIPNRYRCCVLPRL